MKKLTNILFSMTTTIVLLLVFGICIGWATFAENSHGTEFARRIIYNATWFEVLLVVLSINLVGSMIRFQLFNSKKFSVLLFHLAFLLMVIGAGITRYFGTEGTLHLREGETTDELAPEKNSVGIVAEQNGERTEKTVEKSFSENSGLHFSETLETGTKKITVDAESFVPNAIETIVPDNNGKPALALYIMTGMMGHAQNLTLFEGENAIIHNTLLSFNDTLANKGIRFAFQNGQLTFVSNTEINQVSMMDNSQIVLPANIKNTAEERTVYKTNELLFVVKACLPGARKSLIQAGDKAAQKGMQGEGRDAVVFRINDGNSIKRLNVFDAGNDRPQTASCLFNGLRVSISYGKIPAKLPFSITLRKFELERYPGSNSPSSYASEITLTDKENNTRFPFRIYMNNILKYKGYRFFQASYDQDETGTVLSVSHDYWGTMISYAGYFLMMLGMILTLFNKNSRFRTVLRLSGDLQKKRRNLAVLLIAVIIGSTGNLSASTPVIDKATHIKALETLLVQDNVQGRIEPFSTFASDLLRKIAKVSSYNGMSSSEVILGMMTNPEEWKNEALIKVGNDQLAKEIGAINDYVSFNQLFDFENGGAYRLSDKVDRIYQGEEQMARNKYEKEVINLDERINICYELFSGNRPALFPVSLHNEEKWQSVAMFSTPAPQTSGCPYHAVNSCPVKMQSPGIQGNLYSSYTKAVNAAYESGDWTLATLQLNAIKKYQKTYGGNDLPSEYKIKLEVFYNHINPFGTLAIVYIIIGMCLLIVYLMDIFKTGHRTAKWLDKSIWLFLPVFVLYTSGLIIRWYISGHAPWSNGYETMIFVGWATALSGLLFARRSSIALAVTGVLAAIALFVAGMSWMNPEITNLVPVLKSYWLIIHVAIITSSYGFLAMGALLGMLNLILIVARGKKESTRLNDSIQEISYIIELTLSVGLLMLTVGCFIGAIWANESWGRYWGWDPKETWALVSILVYSAILHLRNIPQILNQFVLSALALLGFSTIIMTFFGVNYYLSGMHSYGQGTPPSIPFGAYIGVAGILLLIVVAYRTEKKRRIS